MRKNNKKGVAIFVVLFVLLILGTLMISFHMSSRHAQQTTYRFQTSEMARQLAAAAQEEAFKYLYDLTANPSSPDAQKILNKSSTIDMSNSMDNRNSIAGIDLKVPATQALADDVREGIMEIEAKARIIDFRDCDYHGRKFYDKEGIGTIEIAVRVKAKDQYKNQFPGACTIIRHHDYKIVSILSNAANRENAYVGNSCLDYALFIRNGQYEFETHYKGTSLNPDNRFLEINAGEALGKVNLGSSNNKYTFLNLSNSTSDFIASAKTPTLLPSLTPTSNQINEFFPELERLVKNAVNSSDVRFRSIVGHTAKFEYVRLPITNEIINNEELQSARNAAALSALNKLNKVVMVNSNDGVVFYNGIKIEPVDQLDRILETDVRKQFLNFGYFILDLSNCIVNVRVKVQTLTGSEWRNASLSMAQEAAHLVNDFKNKKLLCLDKKYCDDQVVNQLTPYPYNLDKLSDFIKNHSGGDDYIASKAFTYINDEYAYDKTDEPPIPNNAMFYTPSGAATSSPAGSYHPYAHFNLWNKRNLDPNELESLGIYNKEKNELYLRGVVHCLGSLDLGDSSRELKVYGSGVIIAKGTIRILGAIKKNNPNDVCVIFARDGRIEVNTDKEIQCALIAMGKGVLNSDIIANSCLNLSGSIATDHLRLPIWKSDVTHKINYDVALAPNRDLYQINIAKWVTFERVIENE